MSKSSLFRPTLTDLDALRDSLLRVGGASLDLQLGDMRLRMVPARNAAAPCDPATPEVPDPHALTIDSDGPGILRLADPTGGAPFAPVGIQASEGQIVALLQVGAALWPVHATAAGRIEAVLAGDGDVVGYGTPLFRIAR